MFRIYLAIAWTALAVFTGLVVMNHGMGLLPVFFGGGVVIMATLFVLHRRHRGDMRKVLLGANA